MKKLVLILAALSLFAGSAMAANEIGMYLTQDANPDNNAYNGAPGTFTAYVVLSDPTNFHLGDPNSDIVAPIGVVGGFEFRLVAPASAYVLNAALPPLTTNFATAPDYLCGSNAPVVDGNCTLLTLTIGAFTGTPDFFYLSPVTETPQSIPNSMAITDYNDYFRLNPAYPMSGDYSQPVFGLWTSVVPTDDAAWGEVKSLYR